MKQSTKRLHILIVDDIPGNIKILKAILSENYELFVAVNGRDALEIAQSEAIDLILLDIVMPEMDGYEVCRRLKADIGTASIPIIFLTSQDRTLDEAKGLMLGAVDFILKPIDPFIVRARILTQVSLIEARNALLHQNDRLEQMVAERTLQLRTIQDAAMVAMGSLAETRDPETGNHIRRTQYYVKALAIQLMDHPQFRPFLSQDIIEILHKSAPLHDIGKVGVPDRVLLKPGKLTADEFQEIKKHPILGYKAILEAEKMVSSAQSHFLELARDIVLFHHEKWDGTGYPYGISQDKIPISARLMTLADVYDALISKRVYKSAYSHQRATEIILEGRGRMFDPEIVDAFLQISDQFQQIAYKFADSAHHTPDSQDKPYGPLEMVNPLSCEGIEP
ncbi:MAG: response regulator [Magnetococcales bacterium]|nr:response regulator [Magnetococcales bacterium]